MNYKFSYAHKCTYQAQALIISHIQENRIYQQSYINQTILFISIIILIKEMPRGGSRGGSRSPPPRSSFAASRPQPAQTHNQAPMQQTTQKQGMFSGIGSTIAQGMAFGAGS